MKNLMGMRLVQKIWAASVLVLGLSISSSVIFAQARDMKAELASDFDRIEEVLWNEPSQQLLMGLVQEETATVEEMIKEGFDALPALLEIITSSSSRYTGTAKMVALGVAANAIPEDKLIKAWEDTVQSKSAGARTNISALENILGIRIIMNPNSKILPGMLTKLSEPNEELKVSILSFLKSLITGMSQQGMRLNVSAKTGNNPFRPLVDDPRLRVRQDALFILVLAGDDSDFDFVTEKMLDPKYDYESRISIPTLLSARDSGKAFEPLKKLLDSKDANGKSISEVFKVECVNALSECTTESVGDMIPVQNDDRVDEIRDLFNKIAANGTEYRLRFAALSALASPPFLTEENTDKVLDQAEVFLKDASLPQGFRSRVGQLMMMIVLKSKNPQELIAKRQKKAAEEQSKLQQPKAEQPVEKK